MATNTQAGERVYVAPNSSQERHYVIPPPGRAYCFQQEDPPNPADIPTCPNLNYNGTVPPDPNIGPEAICPSGEQLVIVNGKPVCGKVP